MDLVRLSLVPDSPWRTPWQSDTLAGMLLGQLSARRGGDWLREHAIAPALAGQPPFVLSDAFPGDRVAVPISVRLQDANSADRKRIKAVRWISTAVFRRFQTTGRVDSVDLPPPDERPIVIDVRQHNTLDRTMDTTRKGGGLYAATESLLGKNESQLTVYARIDPVFRDTFAEALNDLTCTGFGADRGTGRGQFSWDGRFLPANISDDWHAATGVVVLSTWQPSSADPIDGCWEPFTKYGRLGPELGTPHVFKRPLILFKPGAVLRTNCPPRTVGRAISMTDCLAPAAVADLQNLGIEMVQWAFGVAVPIQEKK